MDLKNFHYLEKNIMNLENQLENNCNSKIKPFKEIKNRFQQKKR